MDNLKTAPYAALILRLALGIMFFAHAGLKYFTFTLPGTAAFFQSHGLPYALAYVTFFAELIIGLLLVTGYKTRLASLAAIPILLGTIVFVHGSSGWLWNSEGGGWEYPAFLIAVAAAQFMLGDGALAASAFFEEKREQHKDLKENFVPLSTSA